MKATRKFRDSWFFAAIVIAIVLGELISSQLSGWLGLRHNPVVVAFLGAGLVAAAVSIIYKDMDIG